MTKRLNLNNYDIVSEDDATLVIVPLDIGGVKQPLLYFKNKTKPMPEVIDIDDAVWIPTIYIYPYGTPEEYIKRVKWWFNNASNEYKEQLRATYRNLNNYDTEIRRANTWLLTEAAFKINRMGKYIKRKKDIGSFMRNWLNRSLEYQDRRQPR